MGVLEDDPLIKASGENFPVALRVLPARTREDLHAIYRYARHVDDLGDEASGDRLGALEEFEREVRTLYDGDPRSVRDPVVAGLASTVARRRIPAGPLLRLIEANRQDQRVTRYPTFDALVGYCGLSADPVGELVLHVFGRATTERLALSNRICTALQLVEHWQDVAEDYQRGRIYLPQADLHSFGVAEEDLGRTRATPALRALIAFECQRAEAWLDSGVPLLPTLSGWARLAVSGYVAGGRAALAAIRRGDYDPLQRVPKPTSRHIAGAWFWSALRGWG
ncbi:squalene synthase HpnC [Actinopolymorpha alba]|uniref:squalene synthase HpnC n=1 Tax=Actinopolymorpha alba TaxID=533267 RepID=UPI00036BB4A4|nr:squalene synthase HpnC [Actinopolymorpha alba]